MVLGCREGHRLWSSSYDDGLNPLLALESRIVTGRLGPLAGVRFLDAAAGTGRWMAYAASHGAIVFGFDLCPEMLRIGAAKQGVEGRLAVADAVRIPLRDRSMDLAVCSFALGYFPSLARPLEELARVARRVLLTDLHPSSAASGWKRGFRANGAAYELQHYLHSESDLERCAREAGLVVRWREDAHFGEPERGLFEQAGKQAMFDAFGRLPAVWISEWEQA
ncbi:MAG: class I SAM-dependent methyltransferase [Acidobacteria bacterium]|nr:class I SAM-dependent methyltransferase [Acidobacteriota bacterium]